MNENKQAEPVDYVVSAVLVKQIPTGVNTQNKLYAVNASNKEEAHGIVLGMLDADFPEHQLHTMCSYPIAHPAPAVAQEPVAWLCEWEEGWHQYHDAADPLPDEWDDVPKKITPLYAYPAAAINEQLYTALEGLLAITRDSQGVAGYHLNGVVAKWDEFEEVSAAEAAIAAAEKAGGRG